MKHYNKKRLEKTSLFLFIDYLYINYYLFRKNMEYKELLENYRAQIDTLDKEIIYLLSRRFTIVNQVWILKKENNIKPLQSTRWNELLTENIEVWKELEVWEEFIRDVWERIHEESLKIEK